MAINFWRGLPIFQLLSMLLLICSFHASATPKWERLGERLEPYETPIPAVVEFFSFYCPPCYTFSQTIGVDHSIRQVLPEGTRLVKYHVGLLGPLGPDMTKAWALAMVMNVTEPVEKAFFTAMMVEKKLNSLDDIRDVFISATGITRQEYDREKNSPAVKDMVALQERNFKEFKVRGTPSVYVRGQYHINNAAFGNLPAEVFRLRYADTVRDLLMAEK